MEQITYERPREKLRLRGVSALSNAELLQLIIGSGSATMPVARIARKVNDVINTNISGLSVEKIQEIDGLGNATACRIVAALELGRRFSSSNEKQLIMDATEIIHAKKRSIAYVTLSGGLVKAGYYFETIKLNESTNMIAKRICARALADNAQQFAVMIGYARQQDDPDLFILSLVNDIKEIARLLQLSVYSIEQVSKAKRLILHKAKQ